jgi:RimJ/RimL family protein N-acetyltransferase
MTLSHDIRTARLLLRAWREADRAPFAAINADPQVAAFLPAPLSKEESDVFADRIAAHFERHGFGLWAVEIPGGEPFAGYVGLSVPTFETAFTPCVEISWRLASHLWNRGYATEAARAVLDFGFEILELEEIYSFTVPQNLPSRRVMEKIGMRHQPGGEFDHPGLPEGHPLRRHVLYKIERPRSARRRSFEGPEEELS